jgi:hypothetical protein
MQNWRLPTVHIRRYTLRPDGFVSIQAGYTPGELTTKPFRFQGSELRLNYSASAVGWMKVEIQDASGKPVEEHTLDDCSEIIGDKLDATIRWKSTYDVSAQAGKSVRLRFVMSDCDLYAFRFE